MSVHATSQGSESKGHLALILLGLIVLCVASTFFVVMNDMDAQPAVKMVTKPLSLNAE